MEKGFYLLCLKDWTSIVSYGHIQRNLPRCSLYVGVRPLEIPFNDEYNLGLLNSNASKADLILAYINKLPSPFE